MKPKTKNHLLYLLSPVITVVVSLAGLWFVLWVTGNDNGRVECYRTYPIPGGGYAKVDIKCPASENYDDVK